MVTEKTGQCDDTRVCPSSPHFLLFPPPGPAPLSPPLLSPSPSVSVCPCISPSLSTPDAESSESGWPEPPSAAKWHGRLAHALGRVTGPGGPCVLPSRVLGADDPADPRAPAAAMAASLRGGRSRAGAEGLAGPPPPPCRVAQGSLVDTLREVRPTTFYGVPWIWERLLDNLKTSQLACTAFRRAVDKWAMGLGLETNRRRMLR